MDAEKVLDDLIAALDELWRQKAKQYNRIRSEYIRGQMNLVNSLTGAVSDVKKKNQPPDDIWEWVRMITEEER